MTMNKSTFASAALIFAMLSRWAAAGPAETAFSPRFANQGAFDQFVAEGWSSPFGVDYVLVHTPGARDHNLVDGVCGKLAIRWANFAMLDWQVVERNAPRNGKHIYNWRDLDEAVRTWQRNGVHIMISMRLNSPWATAPKSDKEYVYLTGLLKQLTLKTADYIPAPEHMQDFRDYIRNLVERYDGDGKDDMPGLLFPVLHFQVGNEYYNEVFWAGTADEYGILLREAAAAARAACPDVKIILSGIGFQDVYGYYDVTMDPRTEAYVKRNLPKVPPNMKKFLQRSYEFSKTTVGFHDAYDILDARWPNYGIIAKSRELLQQAGCPDKEIWSAEIYSGFPLIEPLVLPNWTLQAWPTPSRSQEYMRILKSPRDAKFNEVNAWYRGLQAAQVVKICMVALDAGSRKLMMGWAVDAQNLIAVSTLSHHGLYSATFQKLWPAGYTYDLTIRKLDGLTSIRRLSMPENVYVYKCTVRGGKKVLVAFYDDHIGQNHDQATGQTSAEIPLEGKRARVTHIITEIDHTEPKVEQVDVDRGTLRLTLTEYPVFIETEF